MRFTGTLCILSTQLIWGLSPIYFKNITCVSPYEVVAHRIIWSALILVTVILFMKKWSCVLALFYNKKNIISLITASFLLAILWFIFGWAVINNHVVDASIGYIISPLLNIALGYFLLKEKLAGMQKVAIILALVGVSYQIIIAGIFPWVSLILATSFSAYALLKKQYPLPYIESLLVETALLCVPALIILTVLMKSNTLSFSFNRPAFDALLAFSGVITCLPFILYAIAVRHVELNLLGILQFIAPLIMFLLGVCFYHEAISQRVIGISFIILAQCLYFISLYQQGRSAPSANLS